MATTISDSLNMNSLQNVYVKAGINRGNCTAIQVYFSGMNLGLSAHCEYRPLYRPLCCNELNRFILSDQYCDANNKSPWSMTATEFSSIN